MRRTSLGILSILLSLSLFSPSSLFAQEGSVPTSVDTVTITAVKGFDRIVLSDGRTISLLGVALPRSKAITDNDCVEALRSLIEGKEVLVISDSLVQDRKGKPLQRHIILDGLSVGLTMIAQGFAVSSAVKHSESTTFTTAQSRAQSEGRGAHAGERSTPVQCSGTTQKGTRCKRMTTNLSGKCWQHGG